MKKSTPFLLAVALPLLLCISPYSYGAFRAHSTSSTATEHVMYAEPDTDTPKKAQQKAVEEDEDFDPAPPPAPHTHTNKHAFLGWFSFLLGIASVAAIALPGGTLVMYLFGFTAGICGKAGLKKYRHNKGLKALCIIAIVLGFIAVLFATLPILGLLI